jgi:hypothetical protein
MRYNVQFKFEFRSGRMIFGWFTALELVFFVQMFSCPDVFFNVLWDIDLIFGMLLYLDELQFNFEFRSDRMIFGWIMILELVFFVQTFRRPMRYYMLFSYQTGYIMWHSRLRMYIPFGAILYVIQLSGRVYNVTLYTLSDSWITDILRI